MAASIQQGPAAPAGPTASPGPGIPAHHRVTSSPPAIRPPGSRSRCPRARGAGASPSAAPQKAPGPGGAVGPMRPTEGRRGGSGFRPEVGHTWDRAQGAMGSTCPALPSHVPPEVRLRGPGHVPSAAPSSPAHTLAWRLGHRAHLNHARAPAARNLGQSVRGRRTSTAPGLAPGTLASGEHVGHTRGPTITAGVLPSRKHDRTSSCEF